MNTRRLSLKAIVITAIIAIACVFAAMPAMAADGDATTTTTTGAQKVKVTKTFKVPDDVTPSAITATFSAGQYDPNDDKVADVTLTIPNITYPSNKTGTQTVSEEINLDNFTTPGEYNYIVQETTTATTNWTTDTQLYHVQILVKNDNTKSVGIVKTTASVVNGKTTYTDATTKENAAAFTDTYRNDDAKLVVSKKVAGDYGDKSKEFTFTINLTYPSNVGYNYTNNPVNAVTTKGTLTNNTLTVSLKDSESVTISNLPEGTVYTVSEVAVKDYTASYNITGDNTANASNTAANTVLATGSKTLKTSRGDTVAYTNTYRNITVTGVMTTAAPYVAMIAIGVVAVALYVVSRRRKNA